MKRIFIDSNIEVSNEDLKDLNIQMFSFEKTFSNNKSLNQFVLLLEKYLKENNDLLLISDDKNRKIVNNLLDNSIKEKINIINLPLPEKSKNLIINEIKKHQNQSMEYIIQKINLIIELHEMLFYSVLDC